jgi:translation elongation factor EF-Ts
MSRYNIEGYTYGDNYAMLDALKKNGLVEKIKKEHREAIEGDLTFSFRQYERRSHV